MAVQRTRTAANARATAAAAARERAKKQQEDRARKGSSHLKWDGDRFQASHNTRTIISAICYVVQEKHHPEGIPAGEIYYKRPYKRHGDLGAGERKHGANCPTSFNARCKCDTCDDIAILRKAVFEKKKSLTKEQYQEQLDSVSGSRAKDRELMLIFVHSETDLSTGITTQINKVQLMDEAVGGGSLTGFPIILTNTLVNPPRGVGEDAAAFYLDGKVAKEAGIPGEGMALEITWKGSDQNRKNDWIRAERIDFVPRKEAPVPDWAWDKAVDLSTLLIRTTNEALWAEYQGLEDEPEPQECATGDGEQSEQEEPEPPPNEEPEPEPEPAGEEAGEPEDDEVPFEPDFDAMSKDELLAFGEEHGLQVMVKGKETPVSRYKGNKEEDVRKVVKKAWAERPPEEDPESEPEPEPPPKATGKAGGKANAKADPKPAAAAAAGKCPGGGTFGKDFNELAKCSEQGEGGCPQKTFDACADESDRLTAGK